MKASIATKSSDARTVLRDAGWSHEDIFYILPTATPSEAELIQAKERIGTLRENKGDRELVGAAERSKQPIANCHNAALAAERQRREQAEQELTKRELRWQSTETTNRTLTQQLLSALAAIADHNQRLVTDPRLASKRIDIDLPLLHQHDANLRAKWEKEHEQSK